ncbi:unnamed protein product [Rangifer tarandus platyrhynchus]|uniref:Secreted protein n=1 Tax=Rangifer tarandus platyrhynchus TaxID=3082113 RepID=A0ABN8XWJ3_RANTA|nr:unnamed protein product [Rangifer tarandus platyrhynchus]
MSTTSISLGHPFLCLSLFFPIQPPCSHSSPDPARCPCIFCPLVMVRFKAGQAGPQPGPCPTVGHSMLLRVTGKSEETGDSGPPHRLSPVLSVPLRFLPSPSPLHFSAFPPSPKYCAT